MHSKQVQIDQNLLLLKQDQVCSNNIMCKVLAELEKLAFVSGYKGKPIFSYYSNSQMDEKEIISQISFQMNVFQASFQSFLRKHNNKYEYPENLPLITINEIIGQWIKEVNQSNPNNSIFFLDFLNVINGNSLSQSCQKIFNNLGKNDKPMNKRELKRQMNNFTNSSGVIGERLYQIEEEIARNGNYSNHIKLNKKREDNPIYQRLNKDKKIIDSYNQICDKNLLYIMAYLEYIAFEFDNTLRTKYQYIFINNTPNKFTITETINKRLNEFCDYYLKLENYDGYEFPQKLPLVMIENQIKEWIKIIPDTNDTKNIKIFFFEVLSRLKDPLNENVK